VSVHVFFLKNIDHLKPVALSTTINKFALTSTFILLHGLISAILFSPRSLLLLELAFENLDHLVFAKLQTSPK
jgi:hypothetical protein